MKQQIGIFINLNKQEALKILNEFFAKIQSLSFHFVIQKSLSKKISSVPDYIKIVPDSNFFSKSELIVAFGGDGTILRTVHLINKSEIPILGVNIGSLGFLAATSIQYVIEHINQF